MRLLIAVAALLCALSCARVKETPPPFSFDQRVGWFHGPCLAIANGSLTPDSPVTLVLLGETQTVRQARLQPKTDSSATCPALLEGRAKINAKPGWSFYALASTGVEPTDMGIAVLNAPSSLSAANGVVSGDVDGDGKPEIFSSCATQEGINFAVWSEKANEGKPRWLGHEYLDYDLTPTCPASMQH